jgi:hypothetical protein
MRNWRFGMVLLVGLLAAAAVTGCAEERDPINRVQPNVVKKAMLEGEWYFHKKVVDVPGGMLQGFYIPSVVGWYADPSRVRFDIQEKFLYVRRTNELVIDAETYSQPQDDDFSTYAIVATYRIEKHFDIQRDYNSVTGESYNVVSENAMDRPWWEREYMRVDWSQNLSPGYDFDVQFVSTNPTSYYVQDECTPDLEFASDPADRCVPDDKAPYFDIVWNEDGSELEKGYFDITNAFVATPESVYYEYFDMEIPGCWLFGNDAMECVSTMYFVRNSFWKINEDEHDYQPMEYSGAISDQIGFFETNYLKYDPQTSINEATRRYFITRHNIWEQSHSWNDEEGIDWEKADSYLFNPQNRRLCHTTADCCPDYDPENPASAAACKSICDNLVDLRPEDRDVYEERNGCSFHVIPQDLEPECEETHYCTLPYDERRVRPMVYYTNEEWPEELVRRPDEPKYVPPTEDAPAVWSYDTEPEPDQASLEAYKWAYADDPNGAESRSTLEVVGDRWNAPYVRTINILKMKAAGIYDKENHANTPYLDDDMRRAEGGQGAFAAVGKVAKDDNGVPTGALGFDENWYDPERPPFAMCRFNPVLGPDNDPNNVEPDVCWERIQWNSHCVFNPDEPGINPKTGQRWDEASEWPICSLREASPRLGDVRYSFAWWVDKWYEGFRLLGLGPGHSDSVTGETLCGVGHMYMHNDMAARRVVDYTMLLTGDLDTGEYIDGYNLRGWRNKMTGAGTNPEATDLFQGYDIAALAGMSGLMGENLKQSRKFNVDAQDVVNYVGADNMPVHGSGSVSASSEPMAYPFSGDDLLRAAAMDEYNAAGGYQSDEMLKAIAEHPSGGAVEDMLLNTDNARTMLAANGLNPTLESNIGDSQDLRDRLLVTRSDPFDLMRERQEIKEWLRSAKKADFASALSVEAAGSLAHEVQKLRAQGRLPQDSGDEFKNALWRMARKKIMRAVTMHELGHTIGMRHNFASSEDSLNYFEDYWDIRESACADSSYDYLAPDMNEQPASDPWEGNACQDGKGRVGPRFIEWDDGGDPISQYEVYKKLHHYAYTSVMDYCATYHIDDKGVGRYDWAAMLYGYGHHMEVYDEFPTSGGTSPAVWKAHDTWRPGRISSATSDDTLVDSGAAFIEGGVQPGAWLTNQATGQKCEVEQVNSATEITFDCGGASCPGFFTYDGDGNEVCADLEVGDKYAVWGYPVGINNDVIHSSLTIKEIMDYYLSGGGWPLVFLYTYFFSPHYTEWYRNWTDESGEPNRGFNTQDLRDVRDVREFDWRVRSQGNSYEPGFNLKNVSDNVLRVPYAYCTDNQSNISNNCRTRDYGADDWERMHHHIADWDHWYISRSFIRGRVGFMPQDYAGGYYDRMYRVPKDYNNIYALYMELIDTLYNERQLEAARMDPYNSIGSFTMALHDGFNMLMRTIASPDPISGYTARERPESGEYALDADLMLGMGPLGFDIANGGRVFETRYGNYSYDNNCGNSFWRCLWNVGWYYDKVMAIQGLTESATYFVGRDTAHDVRLYRISFFDNFNWQLKKYFAGLLGERWDDWAPVTPMDKVWNSASQLADDQPLLPSGLTQPKLYWRDWANPTQDITNPHVFLGSDEIPDSVASDLLTGGPYDTQWTAIDPVASFTVQVYAALLSMQRFQHNYDMSFYNTSRMWVSDASEVESYGEYDKYFDKENQIVYTALSEYGVNETYHPFVTEASTGKGVSASMIEFANKMKARSTECDPLGDPVTPWTVDDCCDNPYYPMTPGHEDDCALNTGDTYDSIDGMTDDQLEAANQTFMDNKTKVDNYLKRYKGLLDYMVRLTNIFDLYLGMTGHPYDPGDTPGE